MASRTLCPLSPGRSFSLAASWVTLRSVIDQNRVSPGASHMAVFAQHGSQPQPPRRKYLLRRLRHGGPLPESQVLGRLRGPAGFSEEECW